ncbi:NACHT domain-containing protein [Undibacterium flavidum]|uniref:ATP-binding protein n=1 Tax=Undibacterium flavidum TaxID=2762297 RepID=A0ABR6YC63_9BURK|nr:hypothetical protein [Undibacterium flavidum]MBC3874134.1 hypothetical protein [Undibacterium flavidum]
MDSINFPFLVERTCTQIIPNQQERIRRSLKEYRDLVAYVLLGDPGAGKTEALKQEARESGGVYVRARDFVSLNNEKYKSRLLFIDGLDEMRAGGDSRTPLDQIRVCLEQLGNPRVRLSCREADWLGVNDLESLMCVSSNQTIVALHLNPLNDIDIAEILDRKDGIDAARFIEQAEHYGLTDLLRNPQTLNLLVEAVGSEAWPQSRKDVYEMACKQLVRESNSEHRQAKRQKAIADAALLDAAGYLCAIQLLSGSAGFAQDDDAISQQHIDLKSLSLPTHISLSAINATLQTKLFQGDGDHCRAVIHRSVTEFLGARYLAQNIEKYMLPIGRVLALMAGYDGGIVTDLRGLSAWLSVHCLNARTRLIDSDPLGIVLYGDVKHFSPEDKQYVLNSMYKEALRYTWFRSEDWSASPFGALATRDMEPIFKKILSSSLRDDASQALLDCVLDAIQYGERMLVMTDALDSLVRDSSCWLRIRSKALQALKHVSEDDFSQLQKLAEDIQANVVIDGDDEIIGMLLEMLYPHAISPSKVFDYLHLQKNKDLLGTYEWFWTGKLLGLTPDDDLPLLLDQLVLRESGLREILNTHPFDRFTLGLLAQGLEVYGDDLTNERLYDWLSIGLDKYERPKVEQASTDRIARWFIARPNRYKTMIEYSIALQAAKEKLFYRCLSRVYGAIPPDDIGIWYLDKAATADLSEVAHYYFVQTVQRLILEGGQSDLTPVALEFLDSWMSEYPQFRPWLEPFITCSISDWRHEQAIFDRENKLERQKNKNLRTSYFRNHIESIRDGSASPKILCDLAQAHTRALRDKNDENLQERMLDFLDGDTTLFNAVYEGFGHVLYRDDLPSVEQINNLGAQGEIYILSFPCLLRIDSLYQNDPSTLFELNEDILLKLVAFCLNNGNEPEWFIALLKERPVLVSKVLTAYVSVRLRAKKEHISTLHPLAYNDTYADVAKIVLPSLLQKLPFRLDKKQLSNALDPIMKGALRYLEPRILMPVITQKLALKSLDVAQRVYWLACGLLVAPDEYQTDLIQYLGINQVRKDYLASFFHSFERGIPKLTNLPETTLALLIELFAPDCSPERITGSFTVSPAMNTADLVRSMISTLESRMNELANKELERLLTLPALSAWYVRLQGALHSQRIARRKIHFRPVDSVAVSHTLANLQPANAADLTAFVFEHLSDIAKNIRNGNTNDYRQYWSHDGSNKKLSVSKPENDCRDTLLSDLKIHLGAFSIEAIKEGYYAEDKRADIRVSFGGTNGFNIPIEIKKDNHANLWTAIHKQLLPQYVCDPGTDGHGIYLVFWFGGKDIPASPYGEKPRSAEELKEQLRLLLKPEEKYCIKICVIDCALRK